MREKTAHPGGLFARLQVFKGGAAAIFYFAAAPFCVIGKPAQAALSKAPRRAYSAMTACALGQSVPLSMARAMPFQ